jgi:Skp family chaperone for outer membrane proteins
MKRKRLVITVLVVACVGLLVVQGVSQSPAPPVSLPASSSSTPAFNRVEPRIDAAQQDWTFEQLAEALKGVRARQKELKTQEADLLAKMADKIEEKRKDLKKAEEMLRQLQEQHPGKSVAKPVSVHGTGEWSMPSTTTSSK